jgi:hypothetical protein
VDASKISIVSDSILDWINPGDAPRVAGAKSDYYQGLTPPYFAKNAPIDDMSELLLVKGIADDQDIYWGSGASGVSQHKLGFGTAPNKPHDYPFGLKDVFTSISNGKVNPYTADTNVLAILGMDTTSIETFIQERDEYPPPTINELHLSPQMAPQITGRSTTYKVHVTAQYGNSKPQEYVAILFDNSPTDIRVVSFYPVN